MKGEGGAFLADKSITYLWDHLSDPFHLSSKTKWDRSEIPFVLLVRSCRSKRVLWVHSASLYSITFRDLSTLTCPFSLPNLPLGSRLLRRQHLSLVSGFFLSHLRRLHHPPTLRGAPFPPPLFSCARIPQPCTRSARNQVEDILASHNFRLRCLRF